MQMPGCKRESIRPKDSSTRAIIRFRRPIVRGLDGEAFATGFPRQPPRRLSHLFQIHSSFAIPRRLAQRQRDGLSMPARGPHKAFLTSSRSSRDAINTSLPV